MILRLVIIRHYSNVWLHPFWIAFCSITFNVPTVSSVHDSLKYPHINFNNDFDTWQVLDFNPLTWNEVTCAMIQIQGHFKVNRLPIDLIDTPLLDIDLNETRVTGATCNQHASKTIIKSSVTFTLQKGHYLHFHFYNSDQFYFGEELAYEVIGKPANPILTLPVHTSIHTPDDSNVTTTISPKPKPGPDSNQTDAWYLSQHIITSDVAFFKTKINHSYACTNLETFPFKDVKHIRNCSDLTHQCQTIACDACFNRPDIELRLDLIRFSLFTSFRVHNFTSLPVDSCQPYTDQVDCISDVVWFCLVALALIAVAVSLFVWRSRRNRYRAFSA